MDTAFDPYEVLGLPRGATQEQVRTKYRELAARYHPDRGADSWIFKRIREAYEALEAERSSTESRSRGETAEKPAGHAGPSGTGADPAPAAGLVPSPAVVWGHWLAGGLIGSVTAALCSSWIGLELSFCVPVGAICGAWIAVTSGVSPRS